MQKILIFVIALLTVVNIAVAFYLINQPLTQINNYRMYENAIQKCVEKKEFVEVQI